MIRDPVKKKILDVLKGVFSNEKDRILLRDDDFDKSLHLYVVSRQFEGKRASEKSDMLWSVLFGSLTKKEWGRIVLTVPLSPKDAKKYWPPIPELNGR